MAAYCTVTTVPSAVGDMRAMRVLDLRGTLVKVVC